MKLSIAVKMHSMTLVVIAMNDFDSPYVAKGIEVEESESHLSEFR
jgi:hypothetical protein